MDREADGFELRSTVRGVMGDGRSGYNSDLQNTPFYLLSHNRTVGLVTSSACL